MAECLGRLNSLHDISPFLSLSSLSMNSCVILSMMGPSGNMSSLSIKTRTWMVREKKLEDKKFCECIEEMNDLFYYISFLLTVCEFPLFCFDIMHKIYFNTRVESTRSRLIIYMYVTATLNRVHVHHFAQLT